MELLHRRCCGLDVHKETVVACLRLVSDGKVTMEVRTFQTTTADLLRLSEWLAVNGCTHVAMEATGIYWKRRAREECAGPQDRRERCHVAGRTAGARSDSGEFCAECANPGDAQPAAHAQAIGSRAGEPCKTLEDANMKLDSVLTDVMGKSGRAMIEALIAGETNPAVRLRDRERNGAAHRSRGSARSPCAERGVLPFAKAPDDNGVPSNIRAVR
jgi:transposase